MSRKRHGLKKDLRRTSVYTSGWFLAQIQPTAIFKNTNKQNNNNNRNRKQWVRQSDFQSYHTIRFKCLVFNKKFSTKKIIRYTKKQEAWYTQMKKLNQKKLPGKRSNNSCTKQGLQNIILKMFKGLKKDVEKVKKTMCDQMEISIKW